MSDQHFILLRPPGQVGGLLGSDGSNSITPLQPPQDPEKRQHSDPAPQKELPSAISAEGGGPGPAGTSPLPSRARTRQWHASSSLWHCLSHSATHLLALCRLLNASSSRALRTSWRGDRQRENCSVTQIYQLKPQAANGEGWHLTQRCTPGATS